jgi:hypothetical protein
MITEIQSKIMKIRYLAHVGCLSAAILCTTGCVTNQTAHYPTKFRTTDGRTAEIGRRTPVDDGWSFREPHMNKCWIGSDFNFNGYDTLLILPTLSAVQPQSPEEGYMVAAAKENLVIELTRLFRVRNLFTNIVTQESQITPGARVLKLENTITEFEKGSFTARDWAGLFGAGQPVLGVAGSMTEAGKPVFTFEARRSGVSAGAHVFQMSGEDIQVQDIRSMALDITDFAAAIAGIYQPKN